MPYDQNGLRNSQSSASISIQEHLSSEIPYRRYTEGSSFRYPLRHEADVRATSSLDISQRRPPSLSDDFQDSIDFSIPPQRTMSFTGGTNSLPAFLSGNSDRNHSALLQQMQVNERAVENDYSENPALSATLPVDIRSASRNTQHSSRHTRRHRHGHRESSGRRGDHESSSRTRNSREEGTHPAFRDAPITTSGGRNKNFDYGPPPPRPPLSRYHFEHQRPGRALRVSSSLPTSLSFNTGDSILVPMAHNVSLSHHRRHRSNRHRATETVGRTAPRSHRGYSLTPPPVCRANKPRYDEHNNRLTVSSPNVVTQCVDSTNITYRLQSSEVPTSIKTGQPVSQKIDSSIDEKKTKLFQPSHVVISQQPKRTSKKKKLVDDDDEISRQKKGLVVNLNNNVTKCPHSIVTVHSKDGTTTLSSISSKMSDDSTLKKEEGTPMLQSADNTSQTDRQSTDHASEHSSRCLAKSGEGDYECPRCGKCTCSLCRPPPSDATSEGQRPSHCYMCNQRCLCNIDSCVETATCLCCVRGVFYHCSNYEEDETLADKPCSCQSDKCCMRWTLLGALSLCLPCLCCYPLARGCVKLCRTCSDKAKPGCRCKEEYR